MLVEPQVGIRGEQAAMRACMDQVLARLPVLGEDGSLARYSTASTVGISAAVVDQSPRPSAHKQDFQAFRLPSGNSPARNSYLPSPKGRTYSCFAGPGPQMQFRVESDDIATMEVRPLLRSDSDDDLQRGLKMDAVRRALAASELLARERGPVGGGIEQCSTAKGSCGGDPGAVELAQTPPSGERAFPSQPIDLGASQSNADRALQSQGPAGPTRHRLPAAVAPKGGSDGELKNLAVGSVYAASIIPGASNGPAGQDDTPRRATEATFSGLLESCKFDHDVPALCTAWGVGGRKADPRDMLVHSDLLFTSKEAEGAGGGSGGWVGGFGLSDLGGGDGGINGEGKYCSGGSSSSSSSGGGGDGGSNGGSGGGGGGSGSGGLVDETGHTKWGYA